MHFRFSPWIKIYLGARYFSSQVLGINFLFLFVPFLLDKVTFIISNFLNYPWWTWWYTARIFFQERKTDFILLGLLQVDRPQQSESLGCAPTEVLPHPMRHSLPWGDKFNDRSIFPNSQLYYCLCPILTLLLPFHRCWTPLNANLLLRIWFSGRELYLH